MTSHTDITGETDYFYTFRCPVCGIETDISEKDLPISIRHEILDNKRYEYTRRRSWR